MTGRTERTDLHYAALEDRVSDVARLLAAGEKVDAQDEHRFTPLHFAAQQQSLASAKLLVEAGAPVNVQNVHGNSPLWTAVFSSQGSIELVELLVASGADSRMTNAAGRTVLELAQSMGSQEIVDLLESQD